MMLCWRKKARDRPALNISAALPFHPKSIRLRFPAQRKTAKMNKVNPPKI
jgi:hypothetical protein